MENSKQAAYPLVYDGEKAESFCNNGLTKREYFAGLAMQGLLANEKDNGRGYIETADIAVKMADNLLILLEKK